MADDGPSYPLLIFSFWSDRDGYQEFYAMDPDGSNQIRLTDKPANDWMPM